MESGKRYLVDAAGKPFLLQGDAAWSLIAQLSQAQVDQYLQDRASKGFNAVLVNLVEHKFATNAPADFYGDAPFTTPGDFSKPNDAYFNQAVYVVNKASQLGILVLLTPAYLGYSGGDEGWYQELSNNTTAQLQTYGQYVANKFKGYNNILWVEGGDFNPPASGYSRVTTIADAIKGVIPSAVQTYHCERNTPMLTGCVGTGTDWLNVNNIYTDQGSVVSAATTAYNASTLPMFLIEAVYEGEPTSAPITAPAVRAQAYQAVLSGAAGQAMGNTPIWKFGSGWQTALNSGASTTMGYLRTLLLAHNWWLLQPDQGNTFLTNGLSSGADLATAAWSSDGTFGYVYLPSSRPITVNLGKLSGTTVTVRWYDPTNGSYSSSTSLSPSGTHQFTPAATNAGGAGDWVLVLESH